MRSIFEKLSSKNADLAIKKTLNKKGMELVQVAILVAIAVAVGLIFKTSITEFVNKIFGNLNAANF